MAYTRGITWARSKTAVELSGYLSRLNVHVINNHIYKLYEPDKFWLDLNMEMILWVSQCPRVRAHDDNMGITGALKVCDHANHTFHRTRSIPVRTSGEWTVTGLLIG